MRMRPSHAACPAARHAAFEAADSLGGFHWSRPLCVKAVHPVRSPHSVQHSSGDCASCAARSWPSQLVAGYRLHVDEGGGGGGGRGPGPGVGVGELPMTRMLEKTTLAERRSQCGYLCASVWGARQLCEACATPLRGARWCGEEARTAHCSCR